MPLPSTADLPVRLTDDLHIEADPGAQLDPKQAFALAESIVTKAVQRQRALRRQNAAAPRAPAIAGDWA